MASFFNLLRILRIMEIMFSDSLAANKSPRETPCGFSSSSVIAANVSFSDAALDSSWLVLPCWPLRPAGRSN